MPTYIYMKGISGKVIAIGLHYKQNILWLKKYEINTLQISFFKDLYPSYQNEQEASHPTARKNNVPQEPHVCYTPTSLVPTHRYWWGPSWSEVMLYCYLKTYKNQIMCLHARLEVADFPVAKAVFWFNRVWKEFRAWCNDKPRPLQLKTFNPETKWGLCFTPGFHWPSKAPFQLLWSLQGGPGLRSSSKEINMKPSGINLKTTWLLSAWLIQV